MTRRPQSRMPFLGVGHSVTDGAVGNAVTRGDRGGTLPRRVFTRSSAQSWCASRPWGSRQDWRSRRSRVRRPGKFGVVSRFVPGHPPAREVRPAVSRAWGGLGEIGFSIGRSTNAGGRIPDPLGRTGSRAGKGTAPRPNTEDGPCRLRDRASSARSSYGVITRSPRS